MKPNDLIKQTRYTKEETSLLKSLFYDNEKLLYHVRDTLLQFEVSEEDKAYLKVMMTEPVKALMDRIFNARANILDPLFQITDQHLSLGADIRQLSPEGSWPFIVAKQMEIEYITQQMKVLKGEDVVIKIKLADWIDLDVPKTQREQKYAEITAWNWVMGFVPGSLAQIVGLVADKEETPEQKAERLAKDSNQ